MLIPCEHKHVAVYVTSVKETIFPFAGWMPYTFKMQKVPIQCLVLSYVVELTQAASM